MSEALRVALVAEGPTDRVVIECALEAILGARPFVLRQVQPEQSVAFGQIGTGWVGVYRWCKQAVVRAGGRLRDDPLFSEYHLLILHLDADVGDKTYASGQIEGEPSDLPCVQPCPPPSATTDPLRSILLRWAGESTVPPRVVLCTPSKATEAWVLTAVFPSDTAITQIECYQNPQGRFSAQPITRRIQKRRRDYEGKRQTLVDAWPTLAANLSEAQRFDSDLKIAVAAIPE
jgi:hypothetical protein